MKIELHRIKIRDLADGYVDDAEQSQGRVTTSRRGRRGAGWRK